MSDDIDSEEILEQKFPIISIEDEMRDSYLEYAMSVIVGRALPDVRDGLKPVHRRVLYAMEVLGNDYNKSYKKSARIVGDVIGVAINYAKSLVSEAMPQSWLFIQGGLFILVVTALPEGVIGWVQGDGPRNLLNRLGVSRRSGTYPRLELDGQEEIQP